MLGGGGAEALAAVSLTRRGRDGKILCLKQSSDRDDALMMFTEDQSCALDEYAEIWSRLPEQAHRLRFIYENL